MAGSGYGCVRYTFCVVNAILLLAGCGVLGVGLWLRLSHGGHTSLLPQHQQLSADFVLMVLGATAALVAGCGSGGAFCRSRCLLLTYFVVVLSVLVLQLLALALGLSFRVQLAAILRLEMMDGLQRHYTHGSALANIWDLVQRQLRCCGVDSHEDWYSVVAVSNSSTFVPESCCIHTINIPTACGVKGSPDQWYTTGCHRRLLEWIQARLLKLGLAALALVFLQLSGLVTSVMLFCTVAYQRRHEPTYRTYSCDQPS